MSDRTNIDPLGAKIADIIGLGDEPTTLSANELTDLNEMLDDLTELFQSELEGREQQLALIKKQLHKLNAGLIAVDANLNKPYPDDPRWTPYTRFIGPRLKMLSAAVFQGKEISELDAMAQLTQSKEGK